MNKKDLMTNSHRIANQILSFNLSMTYRQALSQAMEEGYQSFKCTKITGVGVKSSLRYRNFWETTACLVSSDSQDFDFDFAEGL